MPRPYEKYVWPGGYEQFAIMDDGEVMCMDCVNDPSNPVHEDSSVADGWQIIDFDNMSNYDDPQQCCHCDRVIE